MADITQAKSNLLAHQELTHPGSVVGSALSVVGDLSGGLYLYHANVEVTANAVGVSYKIQVSPSTSGDEDWIDADVILTGTAAAATEALTATEPGGETSIAMASTTGFAALAGIYLEDSSVASDGEWADLENVVSNTSLELVSGLTTGKDSADFAWGGAERYFRSMPLDNVSRIRIVVIHRAATGSDIHFKAELLRATDLE